MNRPNRDATAAPFARRVWRLVAPYWRGEERLRAWLLLTGTIAFALAVVWVEVLVNEWSRDFYNAIADRDLDSFRDLLLRFFVLGAAMTVGAMCKVWLQQALEMRWRVWLTHRYLDDWLADKVFYRLELQPRGTDNPDQRIQEDLKFFTGVTLDLAVGLLASAVTLVSFVAILWRLSGTLTLGEGGMAIPGYMVWFALGYAIVGSVLSHAIGRPLIPLNFEKQRLEADFRFGLVRLRESAEAVGLYGGEPREKSSLRAAVESIRGNWWRLMRYNMRLTGFRTGYNQIALVVPFLAAAPRYFAGELDLGTLMQTAAAFVAVQVALSWFVTNYGGIAEWKASADRLLTFRAALVDTAREQRTGAASTVIRRGAGGFRVESLDLAMPDGRPILSGASVDIAPGDRLLVTGPSGTGKSTFVRALACMWPFMRGKLGVPDAARAMFLPQRPYMPTGSLREALAYPSPPAEFGDDAIAHSLAAVNLEALALRLDERANWGLEMSTGDLQRIAIVRVLLHRPAWLFLDEATSALDDAGERRVYELLLDRLPGAAMVTVGHRAELARYHARRLRFEPAGEGARVVYG